MLPDTIADVDPTKPPITRQATSSSLFKLVPLRQRSLLPIFFSDSFLVLISHSLRRSCFPELDGTNTHELTKAIDNKVSNNFIVNSSKNNALLTGGESWRVFLRLFLQKPRQLAESTCSNLLSIFVIYEVRYCLHNNL